MDNILTKDQQSVVDRLRKANQEGTNCTIYNNEVHLPLNAFTEVLRLTVELAAVTSERDAAVADLKKNCTTCKHLGESGLVAPCKNCQGNVFCEWKWRGVQPSAPDGAEGETNE